MKAVSGQFDVLSVRRLRLPGRRLERCDGVEAAAELAMLDLGNNAVRRVASHPLPHPHPSPPDDQVL